jgi:23S rRNA (cytidine1920-2'-O)/16S rRNA (cytidine1409-2'-O)-methyltransferase
MTSNQKTPPRDRKPRLDALVVALGLAETRARAQALIMGGSVTVDGKVITKPGTRVDENITVALTAQGPQYVSRGGLKLRHGLDEFELDVEGMVAVDVGASTGGFSDVLLEAGAARVYAIDVGYGQLAWRLRNDPRVVVMERTNIRKVERLPELADLAVVDVSFISLRQVLPNLEPLLKPGGQAVLLIKPQFEAGRREVSKKGVVRDPAVWRSVLQGVLRFAAERGWSVLALTPSPIRGPAGNVEFLVHLARDRGRGHSTSMPPSIV